MPSARIVKPGIIDVFVSYLEIVNIAPRDGEAMFCITSRFVDKGLRLHVQPLHMEGGDYGAVVAWSYGFGYNQYGNKVPRR